MRISPPLGAFLFVARLKERSPDGGPRQGFFHSMQKERGDAQGSYHHGLIISSDGESPSLKSKPRRSGCQPGLLGFGVLVVEAATSTPLSYYNVTATLWGCSGQPLESLPGVILVPLQKPSARSLRCNRCECIGEGRGRDWGEWVDLPQAEGGALALDPHLYPENQKGDKTLVNQ